MPINVIIDVEAGECETCGGGVWDVYRTVGASDRELMATHGKKPAAKKAGREFAMAAQEEGAPASLHYPEGGRTMIEEYEPAEQSELAEAKEAAGDPDPDDDDAEVAEARPFA